MKKQSFLQIVGFVSRCILGELGYILAGAVGGVGFLYIFVNAPAWVMNAMGLENIENKPWELIYLVEFVVCLILAFSLILARRYYKTSQRNK